MNFETKFLHRCFNFMKISCDFTVVVNKEKQTNRQLQKKKKEKFNIVKFEIQPRTKKNRPSLLVRYSCSRMTVGVPGVKCFEFVACILPLKAPAA